RPDELARWIATLEVDYVSWDDDSQHGYFWTFPHPGHPLRAGAQVVVERGQALVVRHGELVTDVLGPGEHTVTPATLPGLAELRGWTAGPVVADLVFLRTGPSPRLRWGTSAPATVHLPGHGAVDLRAYGRFSVRFHDARQVIDRMARRVVPDDAEVEQRLRRILAGRFATALASLTDLSVPLLNDLDDLCTRIREALDEPLAQSGLFLARFDIENLTGPLELGLRPTSRRTQNLTHVARSLLGTTNEQPMKTSELAPCIRCGISIPAGARFCTSCGTAQRKRCTSCGNALPAAARFCSHCGSGQPA
ncbi:MAG: SPFH domain-containing protein, partial [Myxococcales bacterium]|nr:SPFH domain-containing protein [Myxococcales bacterium]